MSRINCCSVHKAVLKPPYKTVTIHISVGLEQLLLNYSQKIVHVEKILDYEQSLFPNLVRRANVKKSARKINRRPAKTGSSQCFAERQFIFLTDSVSLARRTKLEN